MVLYNNTHITQEEMNKWYTHFSSKLPTLSDQERQIVEYITGRIPLFLRALFGIEKFNEEMFLRSSDLLTVGMDVTDFFMNRQKMLEGYKKDEYVLDPWSVAFFNISSDITPSWKHVFDNLVSDGIGNACTMCGTSTLTKIELDTTLAALPSNP